jgi:hypothetical protein
MKKYPEHHSKIGARLTLQNLVEQFNIKILIQMGGTRYSSWLRNYATSRKVAGSIPDEVIGFFN